MVNGCSMWNGDGELVSHLVIQCTVVTDLWRLVLILFEFSWVCKEEVASVRFGQWGDRVGKCRPKAWLGVAYSEGVQHDFLGSA